MMVGTTIIPLNFRWFPPHLRFSVQVYELHCATDGSPILLRLLPNHRLKKNSLHIFPNTYAWTDLHNCLQVYKDQTVFTSAIQEFELESILDYLSMFLC